MHSIQSIRNVFDVVKAARDNNTPFSEEVIQMLLNQTVTDKETSERFSNFSRGYYAEELFKRVYSLLPWVKLIIPLGQEQFPENSKETTQTPDYEIIIETGAINNFSKVLVEVKLVDGEKESLKLLKNSYNVLKDYEDKSEHPLLFAIFWKKYMVWTINCIESFREVSSSYKLNIKEALIDDLSCTFGDYTYIFKEKVFRKSLYNQIENIKTDNYLHTNEKYGFPNYEGISLNNKDYKKLSSFETAVLDCGLFRFDTYTSKHIGNDIEIIETFNQNITCKLSRLILLYLLTLSFYSQEDMYYTNNIITEKSFDIIDTIRRDLGGEKYYALPLNKKNNTEKLMKIQFGKTHIYKNYILRDGSLKGIVLCSHNA